MIVRAIFFVLLWAPLFASAQQPAYRTGRPEPLPINAPTLAVLLANRPTHIAQDEWLRMMQQPVNRSLYPLRITQGMLDTLHAWKLDMRFQYLMVKQMARSNDQPK